jgi:AraC-like DNA-binding protein
MVEPPELPNEPHYGAGGPIVRSVSFPRGHTVTNAFALWAVVLGIRGRAQKQVPGHPAVPLAAGDLHVVAPGVRWTRTTKAREGWASMSVTFAARAHWQPWLRLPWRVPGIAALHVDDAPTRERFAALFGEMHDLYERRPPLFREHILNRTERVLLMVRELYRARAGYQPLDARIAEAVEHIRTHLAETLPVQRLAELGHVSRSRFAQLFRQQVGQPPREFQNSCRIDRAKDLLLLTAEPVSEIAREVGIDDPKYFSRLFARHVGVSPSRFRHCRGR